ATPEAAAPTGRWDALRITPRWGTIALVAVNAAVFLAEPWYLTRWLGLPVFQFQGLALFFSLVASSTAIGNAGEWYRLITANFLHIAWDHFAGDMVVLVILGWAVERIVGTRLLVVAYLLTGTSALAGAYAFENCPNLLGASASIFGLLGLLAGSVILQAVRSGRITREARNTVLLVAAALLLDAAAALPGTDHFAHVWALVAGVPIGLTAPLAGRSRLPLAAALIGLALLTVGLVAWRDATFACHV
ncbi:MAG TPA: rhomboid family intramembrane serine protease, partial [Candidatus Dormibacteraeota bacterium]